MDKPFPGAAQWIPPAAKTAPLPELVEALNSCQGCDLADNGSRPVFGEGPDPARLVIIGEQPGDVEERRGQPFCRPSGKVARSGAGRSRNRSRAGRGSPTAFFTSNSPNRHPGQRRIHQTPDAYEVAACKPWLEVQLNRLRPQLVILLGATAAKSLLGPSFRVTRQRGNLDPWPARKRRSADRHDPPVSGACGVTKTHAGGCSTDWSPTYVLPQVRWVISLGESSHRPNPRDGWGSSRLAFSGRAHLESTEHQTSNVRCVRCRLGRAAIRP